MDLSTKKEPQLTGVLVFAAKKSQRLVKEQSKLENSELEVKNGMCPRTPWKVFLTKFLL